MVAKWPNATATNVHPFSLALAEKNIKIIKKLKKKQWLKLQFQ